MSESNSTAAKTFLITGATGKQGRAVINALLESSSTTPPIHIVALTRSKTSKSAQSLASHPNITVVEGDFSNPRHIFEQISQPLDGVFSVQINSPHEEEQGKALVTAAAQAGVRHIVYASCDRGGPIASDTDPTYVKNFAAKFAIEKHILSTTAAVKARGGKMTYTFLRPVTFFDNLTADIHGHGFARFWEQVGHTKRTQMVSVRDVGWFGAQGLLYGADESSVYHDGAISLAGDELTQPEGNKIFKEVIGKDMAMAPCLVGSALKMAMSTTIGDMFRWIGDVGYAASIKECQALNPEMQDFRAWLVESSAFRHK